MRDSDHPQTAMFCHASIEVRTSADHPLCAIHVLVNPLPAKLLPRFQAMYSRISRPSIPPERQICVLLIQVLYTIRSERQFMEQLNCALLFRCLVGLNPDDDVCVPTVFAKNRDRLVTAIESCRHVRCSASEHSDFFVAVR